MRQNLLSNSSSSASLAKLAAALLAVGVLGITPRFAVSADDAPATTNPAGAMNLAKDKPATASSTENDDHTPAMAVDGKDDTRWCASGADADQWLRIDLQKPSKLTGCEIRWESDDKQYQYLVEGSADGETWKTLSDQSKTTERKQTQTLSFTAADVRYIRIHTTALDEGAWASICELKVMGQQ